jgi:pimeloyl-ACP methyl ester carboxylesterase
MAIFTHNGFRLWFELIGAGRPLVLGHGLSADVEQIKQLIGDIPGWQIIVWDCRGHGRTEPDPVASQLGFDQFAADLGALLDHISVKRAVIGGLSMGAGVAARFAADHPDRTDGLILLRPAWTDRPHPPGLAWIERIGQMLQEVGPDDTERWLADHTSNLSAEMLEGLRQQCRKPRARERAARLTVMPAQAPVTEEKGMAHLAEVPALLTFCPQDPIHPADVAEWWASRLSQAILHELPERVAPADAHRLEMRRRLSQFLQSL